MSHPFPTESCTGSWPTPDPRALLWRVTVIVTTPSLLGFGAVRTHVFRQVLLPATAGDRPPGVAAVFAFGARCMDVIEAGRGRAMVRVEREHSADERLWILERGILYPRVCAKRLLEALGVE